MSRRSQHVPDVLAAVDLGSNSFRLVIARHDNGRLAVVDRLREPVQLAAGLHDDGRLDKHVMARALDCLKRFGQRLRDMQAGAVRVAGTSALRRAHREQEFLELARHALGHPVEVISGREEARLIYAGASQTLPAAKGNRLVVDIGGGSTELIIGRGTEPQELESIELGCVGLGREHFPDGGLSSGRFEQAVAAARRHLEPVKPAFLRRGWECAAGSSGSVRTVLDACRELDPRVAAISSEGIEAVIGALCRAGHIDAIPFRAVTHDRRNVFAGGVAILAAVFSQLRLKQMRWSEGAMREGLLHDMISRFARDENARCDTMMPERAQRESV